MQKTRYEKHEYREAKAFIEDAQVITRLITPTMTATLYIKPNGVYWNEYESKLEAPKDDYWLAISVAQHPQT